MKLKNCTLSKFVERVDQKKLYCFGASLMPKEICEEYGEIHFEEKITAFVDNDIRKAGTKYALLKKEIPIISIQELIQRITNEDILLITSKYYVEIYEQLNGISELDQVECYIWPAIAPQYKTDKELLEKIKKHESVSEQIPKKIHYFWFGKGKIPELHQKCIDSWSRICPEYEIIRWDESNYDITKNLYMKQAYEEGKWGFVPDYARLDVIYEYGGIYLDTDVELIRPLDNLLGLNAYVGFESKGLINLGLGFAARPKNKCVKQMMDDYKNRNFIKQDGTLDLTASPFFQTEVLKVMGIELNNKFQIIEDLAVLPTECLSPDNNMIPHITSNTYSIHHFAGSWTSNDQQELLNKIRCFSKTVQEI